MLGSRSTIVPPTYLVEEGKKHIHTEDSDSDDEDYITPIPGTSERRPSISRGRSCS